MDKASFDNAFTSNGYPPPTDAQYDDFINGIPSTGISSKRELAMFVAQVMHNTGGLMYKTEMNRDEEHVRLYGELNGKQFYGRGYIHLAYKDKYEAASRALCPDDPKKLLRNPELVEEEEWAWKTAFWFWKTNVHKSIEVQEGLFGASTRVINGEVETSPQDYRAMHRFKLYSNVLKAFGIKETPDERFYF